MRRQASAALADRAPPAVLAAELWCDAVLLAGPGSASAALLQQASRVCETYGLARVAARVAGPLGRFGPGPGRSTKAGA